MLGSYFGNIILFCILQQYLRFTEDLRLRRRAFDRLKMCAEQRLTVASSGDAIPLECITSEKMAYVKSRWSCTCDRTHLWLRKLDTSLPGDVRQIGDWLCRAEKRLREMPADEYDSPDTAVKGIQQQLADISVRLTVYFILLLLL